MDIFTYYESPLGKMVLTARDGAITGCYFVGQKHYPAQAESFQEAADNALLKRAQEELDEYFSGKRRDFDLPLAPIGTVFQTKVWQAIAGVPYGQTVSYGRLAEPLGSAKCVRAVGAAVGRNPISIIIPCHRIVGSDGSLTGYAGGLERKRALLDLEHSTPA